MLTGYPRESCQWSVGMMSTFARTMSFHSTKPSQYAWILPFSTHVLESADAGLHVQYRYSQLSAARVVRKGGKRLSIVRTSQQRQHNMFLGFQIIMRGLKVAFSQHTSVSLGRSSVLHIHARTCARHVVRAVTSYCRFAFARMLTGR